MATRKLTKTDKVVLGSLALQPTDPQIGEALNHPQVKLSPRGRKIAEAMIAVATKQPTKGINPSYIKQAKSLLKWSNKLPVA